jgi:predicted flap endonuclease-1-like 5' DNA nuclease
MSSYSIKKLDPVGEYSSRLKRVGIRTTSGLLAKAKDARGRKALSGSTAIPEQLVLKWANMADLMRVKGVGEEYSQLLEAAGVDTVKELRNRNAANLTRAMAKANARLGLVRLLPSQKVVERWIAEAKSLPPTITY